MLIIKLNAVKSISLGGGHICPKAV